MPWRITYWRGSIQVRVKTAEGATQDEVVSVLQKLAAKHFDTEYLNATDFDRPRQPEVRSNRSGTMYWTTGKDFHYTAEWFSKGRRGPHSAT